MTSTTALPSSSLSPTSQLKVLFDSLSKKDPISPETFTTLEQINTLEYAGFIPSKEAILIKNNLEDELFAEGILSDVILDLINQEKLAPEMQHLVSKRKLQGSILFLYTCYLEGTHSSLKPYIIQQQLWECNPKKLMIRMKEEQEKESKQYVTNYLASLKFSNKECQSSLEPLFHPLTDSEFKERFLNLLDTLYRAEEDLPHLFCIQELYELLKATPPAKLFLVTSKILKATSFYQKHIHQVEKGSFRDRQFSLCIAADAIKNAPFSSKLPTFYNLVYGQIKKSWENSLKNLIQKPVVILEGRSKDEKAIALTVQKHFEQIKQPFYKIELPSLKNRAKPLVQALLKFSPETVIAAVEPKHQDTLLDTANSLKLPITFLPPFPEASRWEETSNSAHVNFRIAFPTPLSSDFIPEEINERKVKTPGIPGIFQNTKSPKQLKKMWGFAPEAKVVVIHTPEGDSPWPSHIAKQYKFSKDITLVVVTDKTNKEFIHNLKTHVSSTTKIPLKIYSSLTPLEKEELITLADLVISKERENDSSLIFEANHAKTPVLLDNCAPPLFSLGILPALSRLSRLFYHPKGSLKTAMHEKILNDQNLGIMIRSKENFKLSFEELLFQKTPISTPRHLTQTLSSHLSEMKAEAQELRKHSQGATALNFFTSS
jgi:hypothetical protein